MQQNLSIFVTDDYSPLNRITGSRFVISVLFTDDSNRLITEIQIQTLKSAITNEIRN